MLMNLQIFDAASGLARRAASQQAIAAKNLANIDTPTYKARAVEPFRANEIQSRASWQLKQTHDLHFSNPAAENNFKEVIDPQAQTKPNSNSVSLEAETLRSIEAEREHSRAMAVYQSSLKILRASIGRGR